MQHYRPDIDGLRALAILPVVLFHAHIPGLSGGYVGVDVFFVISGFLIAGIITREIDDNRFSVLRFYERRARRILPALFAVIAASFALAWLVSLPESFADFARSAAATAFFVSNIYFWESTDYFSAAAELQPLLHTWSLAIEEQFYIFFPWLLVLLLRWRRSWLFAIIALFFTLSLAASIYGTNAAPVATFYLLPTRAWELLCGAALALNLVPTFAGPRLREAAALTGLVMILLAVVFFDASTPFPGFAALLPCLGTALVIHAGSDGRTRTGLLLSARPIVFLGLISYSLYLWHWPILAFLRQGYGSVDLPLNVALAAVVLSLLLAVASWRFIEQPFRSSGRIARPQVFAFAAGGTAVALALGILVHSLQGLPWRIDATSQALAAAAEDRKEIRDACMNKLPGDGLCVIGRMSERPSVLLWGDSHAGALMPALDVALEASGRSAYVASQAACAPLLGVKRSDAYDSEGCVQFNKALIEFVDAKASELESVILAGRWALNVTGKRAPGEDGGPAQLVSLSTEQADAEEGNAALFRRGLDSLVTRLRGQGLRVVVLGGVPEIGWDVPSLLATRLRLGLPIPTVPTLEDVKQRNGPADALLLQVAAAQGIEIIPLAPLLCRPDCRVLDQGHALYSDDDHLSIYAGQKVLGPQLAGRIWPLDEGAKTAAD